MLHFLCIPAITVVILSKALNRKIIYKEVKKIQNIIHVKYACIFLSVSIDQPLPSCLQ